MENLLLQLLNGLVTSMLLFIMAAGLSLIFGQMNVINLGHGAFYLLGGYIGLTAVRLTGHYWTAVLIAPLLVAALATLLERLLLHPFYGRQRHLQQLLLTFGLAILVADLVEWRWGAHVESFPPPASLAGQIPLLGLQFPVYRLAIIVVGLLLALAFYLVSRYSRLGAIIQAAVSDPDMVSALGINVPRLFTAVFATGSALAALAGVLGAPITTLYPGLDFEILILTLVVVVIGGLGSLKGAFVGALLIGLTDTFGKAHLPQFSLFFIFALMALLLWQRPSGLFGLATGDR